MVSRGMGGEVVSRSPWSRVRLTASGFGAGAALTVIQIRLVIETYGYSAAFLWFGVAQGGVIPLIVAQTLQAHRRNRWQEAHPESRQVAGAADRHHRHCLSHSRSGMGPPAGHAS